MQELLTRSEMIDTDKIEKIMEAEYFKTLVFLSGVAETLQMTETIKALKLVKEFHKGQKRKSGEPYAIHPVAVVDILYCNNIMDDVLWATGLLHDVVEDTNITYEELNYKYRFSNEVTNVLKGVTKVKGVDISVYFSDMKKDPRIILLKLADRLHNLSTMLGVFKPSKVNDYIIETETYVYDLIEYAKIHYPEYRKSIHNMSCTIKSFIRCAKAYMDVVENKSMSEKNEG